MRVTLIQPAMGRAPGGFVESWKMQPLSMAMLASLTPPEHQVRFYDDRVERIPYHEPTDLVAISTETYTAKRAYQIARRYRRVGVPVVLGGFHATLMYDEARHYADAVVKGEAEGCWDEVLADAERHQLKPLYQSTGRPTLANLRPDRSIFRGKSYLPLTLVETGRGCNFSCDFCSVTAYFEASYNYRPAAEAAREIEEAGNKDVFLVDDNLSADVDRAKRLMRELTPLKIRWMSQATIKTADDLDLLAHMQKSGCQAILIGFESLGEETLRSMRKRFNKGESSYGEALERLRDHGIKVYATFVFGYDTDTPDVFERTLDFAMEQKFFVAAFNHLQPFPGTPLYRRMEAEGRLLYPKWWLQPGYNFGQICFRPKMMEPDALYERLRELRRTFYSVPNILRRSLELKANMNSPRGAWLHLMVNGVLRKELTEKWATPLGDLDEEPLEVTA